MTSFIAIILWELLTLGMAFQIKEAVQRDGKLSSNQKMTVVMCIGAIAAAFAIWPFLPTF